MAISSLASGQIANPYAPVQVPVPITDTPPLTNPMAPAPQSLTVPPPNLAPSPEETKLQIPAPARPREYQSSTARQDAITRDFGPYAGPFRSRLAAKMMEDFGEQYIYSSLNASLGRPSPGERRVVFIGDSITDKWELPKYFPGQPYINRGIGSQVTAQMLVRFHADVIALKPKAVVILAGVNDVSGMLQVMTEEQIKANYASMAELASAHGIKVIFSSILPVNNYTENARNVLAERHPEMLTRLNAWLKVYCKRMGFGFIDYTPILSDAHGLLRADFTSDGIHPNEAAYAAMAPVARKVIDATLNGQVPATALPQSKTQMDAPGTSPAK